jgi:predicted nucleic acid-binding Zn ribbon protein
VSLHRKYHCAHCGTAYRPTRVDQQHCSGKCRTAAHRAATKAREQAEALFRIETNTVADDTPYSIAMKDPPFHFPNPDGRPDGFNSSLRRWPSSDYGGWPGNGRYPNHVANILDDRLRRRLLLLRNG